MHASLTDNNRSRDFITDELDEIDSFFSYYYSKHKKLQTATFFKNHPANQWQPNGDSPEDVWLELWIGPLRRVLAIEQALFLQFLKMTRMKTFTAADCQQFCKICASFSILENLVAKLEFENELNRVCSRSTQIQNPDSSSGPGNNRECKYGVVEEESTDHLVHESRDDFSFLLDTILEIERDYDVTADCDVSCMEHVLQLSP
nr:uncharacterized protein LOC129427303 isoform X2 [Misgurnus anguillicaudatus]